MLRALTPLLILLTTNALRAAEPFALRGYYLTFMRMPAMELADWKQAVDGFAQDNANVIILWTAGGFRSKKFPITWEYNRDHANVTNDFVRALIDYAHTKKIRVLLGFTPFGYDGVNRYPIEHPELKAKKADGSPVDEFGIHCWGWNLCAAQPESQRFMREYISEMCFDFYPNADGLLIESSDYNICRCKDCGAKYYDNEFAFVRWISDEVWKRNKDALILVFPHYFTGQKVPGMDATAARQPFDPRWGLSFSPHSSHFDDALIKQASASTYWTDAPILGTPQRVMEAARAARQHHVTGFIPSLEAFSYIAQHTEGGEPSPIGKRKMPWGLDATTAAGKMPYNTLPARIQRAAVREFSADPDLPFDQFATRLGQQFFGDKSTPQLVSDLLALQRIWTYESDWYWSSPLLDPAFFKVRAQRLKWSASKLAEFDANLDRLKEIASRLPETEMTRPAREVINRWGNNRPSTHR